MTDYTGSCHCGAVSFRFDGDIGELTKCDCSLCTKKNARMTKVHESRFEIVTGQDKLGEYNWNTGVARHFFCSVCGIYTFHKKRSEPDHYGINIYCVDGIDPESYPVKEVDGASMSVSDTPKI